MPVLLPTSVSAVKLALRVWGKHKHFRTTFIGLLISQIFSLYIHPPQGYSHTCLHARMRTHFITLTALSTLSHVYTHTHSLHMHPHPHSNTLTHLTHTPSHTHTHKHSLTYHRKQIKSLITPSPQSYCEREREKKSGFVFGYFCVEHNFFH